MNTLTNNELTTLLNEDAAARATARTIKNIKRRAETLFTAGGYEMAAAWPGLYHVFGPQGQHYMVTSDSTSHEHCTCKSFEKIETCKHLIAVKARLAEEAMCEAYETTYADNDDDAYPEY